MAGISLSAKFKNIKKGMFSPQVAGRLTRKSLEKGIRITLNRAVDLARGNTPVGATGDLQGSIKAHIDTRADIHQVTGRVAWEAPYAEAVDQGAPPRLVPIGPLKAWAATVLGDAKLAYAVRHKIALEGTSGQEFVRLTKDDISSKFSRNIDRMVGRLATDLEKDF